MADAPLDRLEVVPRDARTALVGERVSTIGDFVSADPTKVGLRSTRLARDRSIDGTRDVKELPRAETPEQIAARAAERSPRL